MDDGGTVKDFENLNNFFRSHYKPDEVISVTVLDSEAKRKYKTAEVVIITDAPCPSIIIDVRDNGEFEREEEENADDHNAE